MDNKAIAFFGLSFIGWFLWSRKREEDYISAEFEKLGYTDTGLMSDYAYKPNLVTQDYAWIWDGTEYVKKKRLI